MFDINKLLVHNPLSDPKEYARCVCDASGCPFEVRLDHLRELELLPYDENDYVRCGEWDDDWDAAVQAALAHKGWDFSVPCDCAQKCPLEELEERSDRIRRDSNLEWLKQHPIPQTPPLGASDDVWYEWFDRFEDWFSQHIVQCRETHDVYRRAMGNHLVDYRRHRYEVCAARPESA